MVYFCYIDESGTSAIPGNTSHYILCGVSIPVKYWRRCDKKIKRLKHKYGLDGCEIHTGWIMRKYLEQSIIDDFDTLDYATRRRSVDTYRKTEILRLQRAGNNKAYKQVKKNYKETLPYIHLTYNERMAFLTEIAEYIGSCSFIRIFAECIDKIFFDPTRSSTTVDEQALEQIVSRFEKYMQKVSTEGDYAYGLLIHDNNPTVSKRHTELMQLFHKKGTLWTSINHIIETPLFVNSELTSMVQIADLCAIALRRFFENNETHLFDKIKNRFDKNHNKIVGVRHFTAPSCNCVFCQDKHQ